jgi:DNA modification methylase
MIFHSDASKLLSLMEDDSVDLVFTSPPYEDARTYGIDCSLTGQDWVDWAVPIFIECQRVSKGLVAWVVEGRTRKFQWSATPALMMADLHHAGIKLRKPPIYKRVGIPGSGGPDWLRNDYEFVICSSKGRLPWSDNTAMGSPPKYGPGGKPSHRTKNGKANSSYTPPKIANPGNVIECHGGGGHMGSDLAHENEAPFPEDLARFFIQSFCPINGIVLDPFCGSGTTLSVAQQLGRGYIGGDVRESQVELSNKRLVL